jgi:curli biogenesis system outer membrane secretion channel CsgG
MKKLQTALFGILGTLVWQSTLAQSKPKSATPAKSGTPATATSAAPVKQEPELLPVVAEKGKEVIALYPFTTSSQYGYDFALSAGNAVEAGLVRSNRFTVVERSRFGMIREEEKFKEVNTAEAVAKASKLGAKILVTGHVIAVTTAYDASTATQLPGMKNYIAQMSLSFKIVEVSTATIKKSETILGKGKGTTPAEAMQEAYKEIDRLARAQVAEYLPQRFVYASEVEVDKKNRLRRFKIWGGSDQGLKEGDMIDIYELSYLTNPNTGKQIEEKKLRASAKVVEVNSTESATCELQNATTAGEQLLQDLKSKPNSIVFEYKGTAKKKSIFELP